MDTKVILWARDETVMEVLDPDAGNSARSRRRSRSGLRTEVAAVVVNSE